ncbi:MAG: hypothetical protein KDA88_16895 [Planctomycetaceae bacterium]|nr:hypothetical protein [Planctomycetaceae bacterium]MCB9953546.1 hypothetical protein [Planctomycetaceae bacterium]
MSKIHQASLFQRARYQFDNFMARGGSSIFVSLVVVFMSMLLLLAILRGAGVMMFPNASIERDVEGHSFFRNVYITFLQMTDPGNMAQDIETSPGFKVFSVLSGMTGVVMLSSLIAFITTALDRKLALLRRGHSKVIEEDHTLILGWNERITEILRELVMANESEDDPVVVILADKDKEEMDEYLALYMPDTKNTRVVTRSGVESSMVNLDVVSVDECKAVIVLAKCPVTATENELMMSDAFTIKTILALVACRPEGKELNIVGEVFLQHNREVAEAISPSEVTTVDTNEILAKILVQTSRTVGLSVAYSEILSFDGCEMYFHHAEWKPGITFGELAFHFPDGVPMGLRHADNTFSINPHPSTVVLHDDSILILAEDDSSIVYQKDPVATARDLRLADGRVQLGIERELIIGWTPKVETIVREFADYVLEGSQIDIMLRAPDASVRDRVEALSNELDSVTVRLIEGNPLDSASLLAVQPFTYDNIIILSQGVGGENDVEGRTDSETIIILLLLRNMFKAFPEESKRTKLITEILDSENQALVARAGVYEFIISNRFISMMLAQISEDSDIKRVYDDLFSEDGSEIYLKPVDLYFDELPATVTFADLMALVQKREEVALGVKIKEHESNIDENFGVKLIPEKNTEYTLVAGDRIVVLAENET